MNDLTLLTQENMLPIAGPNVNIPAVKKVTENLPALTAQAKAFGSSNSQSMLTNMTLTMMNGHSPMRMLRQVLAETESRRKNLVGAQVKHAEAIERLEKLESIVNPTNVEVAKLREAKIQLEDMETAVNGSFIDIAVLVDAYENIKEKHGIGEWDASMFEAEEKRHHIRRGFEHLYRSMVQAGVSSEGPTEYLMQYGVHPQQASLEVMGYIKHTEQRIIKGERLKGSDCEDFLDKMADRYLDCADDVSERIFGKTETTNTDYMRLLEAAE